jgi:LysM repeat protein
MHLIIPTSYVPPAAERAAPSPAAPSVATGSTTVRYRVRSGESLWTISQKVGTTVSRLRALNGLGANATLKVDQVIRVPAPVVKQPAPAKGARLYTVRSGDTLSEIAARYGVSVGALRTANGLGQSSVIRTGQQLRIPEGN